MPRREGGDVGEGTPEGAAGHSLQGSLTRAEHRSGRSGRDLLTAAGTRREDPRELVAGLRGSHKAGPHGPGPKPGLTVTKGPLRLEPSGRGRPHSGLTGRTQRRHGPSRPHLHGERTLLGLPELGLRCRVLQGLQEQSGFPLPLRLQLLLLRLLGRLGQLLPGGSGQAVLQLLLR